MVQVFRLSTNTHRGRLTGNQFRPIIQSTKLPNHQEVLVRLRYQTNIYFWKGQHWYANCEVFWADVEAGKTEAPNNLRRLAQFPSKGKQKKVFNVTSEGIANGVLVYSAADSPDFELETLLTSPPTLQLASQNNTPKLTGIGRLWIPTPSGVLELANVYYCPDIQSTILFLGRLIEDGYKPVLNGTALQLVSSNNVIYRTSYVKKCWYLDRSNLQINTISKILSATAKSWHKQLGHASNVVIKNFLKGFVLEAKSNTWKDFFCKKCAKSKSSSVSSGPTIWVMSLPLDLLFSDMAGPFDKDLEGNWFLHTLRDHTSTYTFTAALKFRSNIPNKIMTWIKFIYNMLHQYLPQLQTDNAGEYSGKLRKELEGCGTLWIPTEPYRPDHNGEAERLNWTIGDMARMMMNPSGLPLTFWSYAYSCAAHVHNCLPNKKVAPLTPMECLNLLSYTLLVPRLLYMYCWRRRVR
ncbi:hypothetical protein O181_071875 [Austropuccinia psidii MF-1]|uniref:Integrase catalytic domain-containing protein n=1 Tax=Austropuccinia psidii MF-1 TaxID=1389203 RepID=A0A9Q3F7J7_9BASI|nr:hypothetical protein [Austropuccinia psidii MF-1]